MKKLSILSLVLLFAMGVAAIPTFAAVLYSENFDDGNVNGYKGDYETYGSSGFGDPFWMVTDGKLEAGVSDDIKDEFLFLTGETNWANVAVTTHLFVNNQGSGQSDIIVRATGKDTYYALRYKTGNDKVGYQIDKGLPHPEGNPALQIYKVVNGQYSLIAETNAPGIPNVANGGNYDDKILGIRFVANGARLEAWLNIENQGWVNWLTGTDSELKAGKIGLGHAAYYPMYDDLTVESID